MKAWHLIIALKIFLAAAPAAAGESLIDAVRAGKTEAAAALIADGADVNAAASDGTTALHWAAHNGEAGLVEKLIAAGAKVDVMNDYGATPMSEAVVNAGPAVIAMLLEAGADPDSPNADGQSALMLAARAGKAESAERLIAAGADVNARESFRGQTALMWAAARCRPGVVRLLVENGAEVNARSDTKRPDIQVSAESRAQYRQAGGMTPLLYAAREGCRASAKALLAAGADVNLPDPNGVTPLFLAIYNFHFDLAEYLLRDAGADPNRWDWWGRTPLYAAVDLNTPPHDSGRPTQKSEDATTSLEMIAMLLEAGANPNAQLKLRPPFWGGAADRGADIMLTIGMTPLLRAAKAFDIEAIRLLLAHGAHVNLASVHGYTPVMAAAGLGSRDNDTRGRYGTPDVQERSIAALKILLEAGGDINRQATRDQNQSDTAGQTALHGAAFWGWNKVVKFLVARGARIDILSAEGMSPIDAAMGRARGNGFNGNRIDVHKDTAALLRKLCREKPECTIREVSEAARK